LPTFFFKTDFLSPNFLTDYQQKNIPIDVITFGY